MLFFKKFQKLKFGSGGFRVIRFFDLFLGSIGLLLLAPLFFVLTILGFLDTGSPLFRQSRLGLHQKTFTLLKFRTMKIDTASRPTHLAAPESVTVFGRILRKTKLDELPQLWNVLNGQMSLVGPRPCLPSQRRLIEARRKLGVFSMRPGITGLAQIRGIDMSRPELLAKTDAEMLVGFSIIQYFKYIFLTLLGKGSGDQIRGR